MLQVSAQRGRRHIVSDTSRVPDLDKVAEMSSTTIDVPAKPGKDSIGVEMIVMKDDGGGENQAPYDWDDRGRHWRTDIEIREEQGTNGCKR